jgi:hypothetical protein
VKRTYLVLILLVHQLAWAESLADFFKQTFEERLRDDPEFATTVGRHDYDDRWTNRSAADRSSSNAALLCSALILSAVSGRKIPRAGGGSRNWSR